MDFRSRDKLTAVRGQQLHWCCSCWRLGETGTRVLLSVLVLQSLLLTCSSEFDTVMEMCSYVWVLLVASA